MPEISPALYRAGEGEPLLLLHGFTGTWHHWRPVLADLAARFEVIAPTLAGHDGGPAPAKSLRTLADAADSLEVHLDEIGVESAHVAGNSMGGALGIELAKRGRARSVVALSPGGGWEPSGPEPARIARFFERQLRLTRLSAPRLPLVMRRAASRRLAFRDVMRFGHLVHPTDAVQMARASIRCDLSGEVLAALRRGDAHLAGLDSVAAPVLLAWSQYDRILPMQTCSARLRQEIPGAEFRVLHGVGHVPMWDDPHLVVETIASWVARHAAAPAAAA